RWVGAVLSQVGFAALVRAVMAGMAMLVAEGDDVLLERGGVRAGRLRAGGAGPEGQERNGGRQQAADLHESASPTNRRPAGRRGRSFWQTLNSKPRVGRFLEISGTKLAPRAMPTALRGHAVNHAHAKPWAWHSSLC